MKRIIRRPFLALLAAALLVGAGLFVFSEKNDPGLESTLDPGREACTVIMIGRGASADGWKEGTKWPLALEKGDTGFTIPEVAHTYAFHHGMFGYMNENQVAISESTLGTVRKLVNRTPSAKIDLTMLSILGMERSRTARECLQVMGDLAETYGYGFNDDGEMFAVSDPNEVWVFEIMPAGPLWTPETGKPGAVWCAQRVPDDHVSVCPNESRIGEVNLADKDNFMGSAHMVEFAVEQKLYDPGSGKPFIWKRAYSPAEGSAVSSGGRRQRMWRFFDLVAPSLKLNPETPDMDLPFSVKPDKKISLQDVMNLTRDKSYGTMFDPVQGIRGGPFKNPNYYSSTRKISVANVEYTSLVQCRSGFPAPIGGILWVAFGDQATSVYMPLYAGMKAFPKSFMVGDHFEFNRASARWAMDYVDYHTQVVYSEAIKDVQKAQLEYEGGAIQAIPGIDKAALELYDKSPAKASEYLTKTCLALADKTVAAWWELGDRLLVKYNHFGFYNPENRRRQRVQLYDETWNKAVKMVDTWLEK
jgi:dipeptidase